MSGPSDAPGPSPAGGPDDPRPPRRTRTALWRRRVGDVQWIPLWQGPVARALDALREHRGSPALVWMVSPDDPNDFGRPEPAADPGVGGDDPA